MARLRRLLALLGCIALIGSDAAAVPASSTSPRVVAFARLFGSSSGVVGLYDVVGCGADCRSYEPHLFVTDGARTWREISPDRLPFQLEDIGFANQRSGWLVANDCVSGKAFAYRTSDEGRTWRAARITPCNCAAGSQIELAFADTRHVWVLTTYANGPGNVLQRSTNGGKTWQKIAIDLPVLGAITFATPRDGWLGRSGIAGRLYATHDGGRSWRRLSIAAPSRWRGAKLSADVPTLFGKHGVLPVSLVDGRREAVAFYVTVDRGRTWRPSKVHGVRYPIDGGGPFFSGAPSASLVSPSVWWIASGLRHPVVSVTADGGKTWHESVLRSVPRVAGLRISARDARHAWVTVGERSDVFYATSDGGRTWRRLAPPRS